MIYGRIFNQLKGEQVAQTSFCFDLFLLTTRAHFVSEFIPGIFHSVIFESTAVHLECVCLCSGPGLFL